MSNRYADPAKAYADQSPVTKRKGTNIQDVQTPPMNGKSNNDDDDAAATAISDKRKLNQSYFQGVIFLKIWAIPGLFLLNLVFSNKYQYNFYHKYM